MSSFCERRSRLGPREAEEERQRDVGAGRPRRVAQQGLERDAGRVAEDRNRLRALPLDLGHDGVDERRVTVVDVRSVEAERNPRRTRPQLAGGAAPRVERLPGGEYATTRS